MRRIPMEDRQHGLIATYRAGCHCTECRAAKNEKDRDRRRRLARDHPSAWKPLADTVESVIEAQDPMLRPAGTHHPAQVATATGTSSTRTAGRRATSAATTPDTPAHTKNGRRCVPSITLDIPMLPPTPNQLRGAHWSKAQKVRKEAAWAVLKACLDARAQEHQGLAARIDATIHAHGKAADEDNQWARLKPVIDALVFRGVLVDDSPRWLRLGTVSHQKAAPKKGHVVLTITYHKEEAG